MEIKIPKYLNAGLCIDCQTIHVIEEEIEENRKCLNCGKELVFSLEETSDIVNDWNFLKKEVQYLRDIIETRDEML